MIDELFVLFEKALKQSPFLVLEFDFYRTHGWVCLIENRAGNIPHVIFQSANHDPRQAVAAKAYVALQDWLESNDNA